MRQIATEGQQKLDVSITKDASSYTRLTAVRTTTWVNLWEHRMMHPEASISKAGFSAKWIRFNLGPISTDIKLVDIGVKNLIAK